MNFRKSRKYWRSILVVIVVMAVVVFSALGVFALSVDLTTSNPVKTAVVNGVTFERLDTASPTGSGTFHSFVRISAANEDIVRGYNSSYRDPQYNEDTAARYNRTVALSIVPIVDVGGTPCYEFQLDINQNTPKPYLSLNEFQVWVTNNPLLTGYNETTRKFGSDASLVYDLDVGTDGNSSIKLDYLTCNRQVAVNIGPKARDSASADQNRTVGCTLIIEYR